MKNTFPIGIQPSSAPPPALVRAFILPGNRPEEWLEGLAQAGRSVSEVQCFALAALQHGAEGLFVIAKAPVSREHLLQPYQQAGPGVYIPCFTTLTPALREEEWDQVFRWDVHLFHPILGFWGFHHHDALRWYGYLPEISLQKDWQMAQPPAPDRIPLNKIQVLMPPPRHIFGASDELPGSKPLSEIPGGDGDNFWDRLKKNFGESGDEGSGKGFLDRLGNSLRPNADLEKQRESQLNRLLDMFKENMAEALKYAIPVDSPYSHRGTFDSGSTLTPGSTNFDLSRLGGGQSAGFWQTDGTLHMKLRRQYEEAARQAIANGDYRLAAYIYAHLLGDYAQAAHALRSGGFFREAAVLYIEHLNNPATAAECLEQGGFLSEALDLYEKNGNNLKCAQLYRATGNEEKSRYYWNLLAEEAIARQDYQTAGNLYETELEDNDNALSAYLSGWHNGGNNASACLQRYFLLQGKQSDDALAQSLPSLYNDIRSAATKKQYIIELQQLMKSHYHRAAVQQSARRVVLSYLEHQENDWELNRLPAFFKQDRLLNDDIQRFIQRPRTSLKAHQTQSSLHIPNGQWEQAIFYHDHIWILGKKGNALILFVTNWSKDDYGREVHLGTVMENIPLRLLASPTAKMILFSGNKDAVQNHISLGSNNLLISSPEWMNQRIIAAGWKNHEGFTTLIQFRDHLALLQYGPGMNFQHRNSLQTSERILLRSSQFLLESYHKLCFSGGYFFTHLGSELLRISEHGVTDWISFEYDIDDIEINTRGITAELIVAGKFGATVISRPWSDQFSKPTQPDALPTGSDEPFRIRLLQGKYAFVFSGQSGTLYDISSGSLQRIRQHDFSEYVTDAFPGPDHLHWAVLLQDGTVKLMEYHEQKNIDPWYGGRFISDDMIGV